MAASFQGAISVLGKRKLSLSEKSNFLEKSENKYVLYKVINQYFCGKQNEKLQRLTWLLFSIKLQYVNNGRYLCICLYYIRLILK